MWPCYDKDQCSCKAISGQGPKISCRCCIPCQLLANNKQLIFMTHQDVIFLVWSLAIEWLFRLKIPFLGEKIGFLMSNFMFFALIILVSQRSSETRFRASLTRSWALLLILLWHHPEKHVGRWDYHVAFVTIDPSLSQPNILIMVLIMTTRKPISTGNDDTKAKGQWHWPESIDLICSGHIERCWNSLQYLEDSPKLTMRY